MVVIRACDYMSELQTDPKHARPVRLVWREGREGTEEERKGEQGDDGAESSSLYGVYTYVRSIYVCTEYIPLYRSYRTYT